MNLSVCLFATLMQLIYISTEGIITCPSGWFAGLTQCFKVGSALKDQDCDSDGNCGETLVGTFCSLLSDPDSSDRSWPRQFVPRSQDDNDELVKVMRAQGITENVWIGRRWNWFPNDWTDSSENPLSWTGSYDTAQRGNCDCCTVVEPDGTWIDVDCAETHIPICFYPPLPPPEWSCLENRKRLAKDPTEKEAVGCRSSLTCSSVTMEDGKLTAGMTVNLQRAGHGTVKADIDVLTQTEQTVVIAFTEGTSPQQGTCDAESLGLFLSQTSYGLHGKKVDNSILAQAKVRAGVKATFAIDPLAGVWDLNQLAGHGVVVCPSDTVDTTDGFKRCLSDNIPLCCTLSWVLEEDQQWLQDYKD